MKRAPARRSAASAARWAVISDTHGLLRRSLLRRLRGVRLIVHAGDIGGPDVLAALRRWAPVIAVRGNNDRGPWARRIPTVVRRRVDGVRLVVMHDRADLSRLAPRFGRADLVVVGHSHQPEIRREGAFLLLNPGSCGPRRFRLPVTFAWFDPATGRARLVALPLERDRPRIPRKKRTDSRAG